MYTNLNENLLVQSLEIHWSMNVDGLQHLLLWLP